MSINKKIGTCWHILITEEKPLECETIRQGLRSAICKHPSTRLREDPNNIDRTMYCPRRKRNPENFLAKAGFFIYDFE